MDWKLELIVVPVADVDRAKSFYTDKLGFKLEVDRRMSETFRVVQMTPPGSACSIAIMRNESPGTLKGLHLIVSDIEAARAELLEHGAEVSDFFHFDASGRQVAGPEPERRDYNSFLSFSDPDGNAWLVQEVGRAKV